MENLLLAYEFKNHFLQKEISSAAFSKSFIVWFRIIDEAIFEIVEERLGKLDWVKAQTKSTQQGIFQSK